MARQADYNREDVLKKAMELFWAKGYHATSLKNLEAALDMRPGSIYAAFGSKEALFEETLNLYAALSRQQFSETLENADSRLSGLSAHVRSFGVVPSKIPSRDCMLVKTLLETPDDDPHLRATAEKLIRETETSFATTFRAAREAGEIPQNANPEQLASKLQANIFGLRAYAQRTDAAGRIAGLADDIAKDIEALAKSS